MRQYWPCMNARQEKKPEKVCHLVFLEHMLLEKFEKKDIKKYLKEYSHFSLLWGTVLCTKDDVAV